jgi:hypothetical protein
MDNQCRMFKQIESNEWDSDVEFGGNGMFLLAQSRVVGLGRAPPEPIQVLRHNTSILPSTQAGCRYPSAKAASRAGDQQVLAPIQLLVILCNHNAAVKTEYLYGTKRHAPL